MHQILKYFSLPLEFGVTVIAGVFLGYFLDGKWQTGPLFTLVGSVIGLAAGLYNLVRAASRLNR